MKNLFKNFKRGFTLIELLVVIAIIGLLASIIIVGLSYARNEAKAGATKTTLSDLRSGIALCCENPANSLQTTAGQDFCNPSIGISLPTAANLLASGVTYNVAEQCSGSNPGYTLTLSGHSKANCNATWTIRVGNFSPPSGC